MRKKVLGRVMGALLSASMLIVMLPIHNQVKAAPTEYGVWIANKQITSDNYTDVTGDGTISYNPTSKTLTLKNANISTIGDNQSTGEPSCIYAKHDLTIEGSGKISYNTSYAIYGVDVEGGNLTLNCDLTISLTSGYGFVGYGLKASGRITINGGTIVCKCEGGSTHGIDADTFIMNEGNVTVVGRIYGILTRTSTEIKGGTLNCKGYGEYGTGAWGIDGAYGTISITGGNVTAYGRVDGITSYGNISVTGGYVDASVASDTAGNSAIRIPDSGSGIITIGSKMWVRDGYISDNQKSVITKTSSGTTRKKAIIEKAPDSYSVTVNNDGNGTGSANKTTGFTGEEITLSATPNPGYHFKQWQVVSGGVTITNNKFIIGSSDVVIKAIFEADTYSITVNNDGNGTGSANKSTGIIGDVITLTANPKPGYHFKQWQVVSGGVTVTNNKFTIGTSDVVIKAIFEQTSYTITVNDDGNGTGDASLSSGYIGDTITLTANPKPGFKLKEWQVVSGGVTVTNDTFTIGSSDVVIKAVFEAIPYSVTVTSGTADKTTATVNETVTITASVPEGKKFVKWNVVSGLIYLTDENSSVTTFTMETSDVEIEAVLDDLPTHAVTVTDDGHGTATASADSGWTGRTITLDANPEPGYKFKEWIIVSGDASITDPSLETTSLVIGTNDTEVQAAFEVDPSITFNVTVNSGSADMTVSVTGATVTLTADAAPTGKEFDKWVIDAGTFTLDDETSTTTTFTMPNEDVEVTATYKDITYTVTFETNGGSAVASQTVVYGNKAAKPADPTKDGFKFDGWYQDPSFAADFNFDTAITADTTVYAKWVEAPKSSEVTYTVVQGADGSWTLGSGEDYVVIVKRSEDDEHCIDYFKGARIDDKELVAGTDYTAVSGSTVLTIKAATLEALGAGSHTITVVFNDAEISTKLTFTAKDETTASASTAQTNTAATTPAVPTPASTAAAVTSAPSKAAGSKVVKTGEKASATSKIAQVFVGLSVIALGVLFIERRKRKNEE